MKEREDMAAREQFAKKRELMKAALELVAHQMRTSESHPKEAAPAHASGIQCPEAPQR